MTTKLWYKQEAISLSIEETPTFEQFDDKGADLANVEHALPFLIGDWARIGHDIFGEQYFQATRHFVNIKERTIGNYASTCRKVAPEVRRTELSFSHHKYVRTFEQKEQIKWLDKAVKNKWTSEELRAEIKKAKGEPAKDPYLAGLKTARNKLLDIHQYAPDNHLDALDDITTQLKQMQEDVDPEKEDIPIEVKVLG